MRGENALDEAVPVGYDAATNQRFISKGYTPRVTPHIHSRSIPLAVLLCLGLCSVASANMADEATRYRKEGYRLQQQGNYAGAITQYQKAAQLDPASPTPHNDLGVVFEAQGQPDRAEQEYVQAVGLNGRYVEALSNLALLYEKRGEREKAAYYWLQRAKFGDPGDPRTVRAQERLVALGAAQNLDQASQLVQEERRRLDRALETTYAEAKEALQSGQYGAAIRGFREVIALERTSPQKIYTPLAGRLLTEASEELRTTETAQLGRAHEQQQQLVEETYTRAKDDFLVGRLPEARAGFERVLALEREFGQDAYTPFATEYLAQARQAVARDESPTPSAAAPVLTPRSAVAHGKASRAQRSAPAKIVQEQMQRNDRTLRDFRALTEQRDSWPSRR